MNASLSRVAGRVLSILTTLLLLTISVCANAQSNVMSIAGGNGQSAYTGYALQNPLTVSFSGASYVTLDWTATNGAVIQQGDFTPTFSETIDTSLSPTASVNVYAGSTAGPFQVTVTCSSGCSSVQTLTFNETALQQPPNLQMLITGGNNQSGPPNTVLPAALQVTLTPTPLGYEGPPQETITSRAVTCWPKTAAAGRLDFA